MLSLDSAKHLEAHAVRKTCRINRVGLASRKSAGTENLRAGGPRPCNGLWRLCSTDRRLVYGRYKNANQTSHQIAANYLAKPSVAA